MIKLAVHIVALCLLNTVIAFMICGVADVFGIAALWKRQVICMAFLTVLNVWLL